MKDKIELSVIMPGYNEEDVIAQSINKMIEIFNDFKKGWEIIVVDDGSTDKTKAIIESEASKNAHIKIISYKKNRGRGYALRQGIAASRGKYVVTIESDTSWGTDIVFELYDKLIEESCDIVVASFHMKGGHLINVPFSRVWVSRLGNIILRLAFYNKVSTISGMTRGYRGDAIRNLDLREDRKEIHLEILSRAFAEGFKITEIPATIKWPEGRREKVHSRGSVLKILKLSFTHLFFGFTQAPLLLFGPLAAFCLSAGIIIELFLSYKYFIKGQVVGDKIVLILSSIFLIVTGLQFFIICFLSYQTRETQNRLFQVQNSIFRLMKKNGCLDEDV